MVEKITTKSKYINYPTPYAPLFSYGIIAYCGNQVLTGWCKNKKDLEILRKRVVRKLRKLLSSP